VDYSELMKTLCLSSMILFGHVLIGLAQTQTFAKVDGEVVNVWGAGIIQENANSFLVAGSFSNSSGKNIFIRKIDSLGSFRWLKTYKTVRLARIYCHTEVVDSHFIIAGEMDYPGDSLPLYTSEIFMAKFHVNGDTVWTKRVPWAEGANKVLCIISSFAPFYNVCFSIKNGVLTLG
jgi:hypothetical protein